MIVARRSAFTASGQLVTADQLAGVVAWLCTEEARQIRGQVIVVDGGLARRSRLSEAGAGRRARGRISPG
ncbi:MAG: SDR family oxidoreductase [Chloroflexi bacterium]|nr:SDR family oxidoreductase [Chloroflexota bacterium]